MKLKLPISVIVHIPLLSSVAKYKLNSAVGLDLNLAAGLTHSREAIASLQLTVKRTHFSFCATDQLSSPGWVYKCPYYCPAFVPLFPCLYLTPGFPRGLSAQHIQWQSSHWLGFYPLPLWFFSRGLPLHNMFFPVCSANSLKLAVLLLQLFGHTRTHIHTSS